MASHGISDRVAIIGMLYEARLQFRGEAGDRQLADPKLALTDNLGGRPGSCVSFVSLLGRERG